MAMTAGALVVVSIGAVWCSFGLWTAMLELIADHINEEQHSAGEWTVNFLLDIPLWPLYFVAVRFDDIKRASESLSGGTDDHP